MLAGVEDSAETAGQRNWRDLMRVVAQVSSRLNGRLQRQSGVSLADFEVLDAVAAAPGRRLRVFELADALGWEQSRVSHQLARMQHRSLVTRTECPSDGRGAFIGLTPSGRAGLRRASSAYARALDELVFGSLTQAQLAALSGLVGSLRRGLAGPDGDRPATSQ
jgi:DNA-binding MarR family transcriptional regulator